MEPYTRAEDDMTLLCEGCIYFIDNVEDDEGVEIDEQGWCERCEEKAPECYLEGCYTGPNDVKALILQAEQEERHKATTARPRPRIPEEAPLQPRVDYPMQGGGFLPEG